MDSEIAASSGPYKYGYASISRELTGIAHLLSTLSAVLIGVQAGDYTLIISAFDSRHTGPYTVEIDSSARFTLQQIPQEGAGMFSKVLQDAW